MAMKQTQTKMFDFSDLGLDFCAGSKNLFPDRFKKMLALGYNEQTVSSVAVAGNQVTFTYGGTHGYVADRVLKVSAPELLSINGGEFVIDSVTANTVTMTIDSAPNSIAGNFTTKVASLGWSLEYENANIHVYKFKYLDNTDRYLRLCFQDNSAHRNRVAVCLGKTYDSVTGFITDPNSLAETRDILTPNIYCWEFTQAASSTYNNYTYSQGLSVFGLGVVVGSIYHMFSLHNTNSNNTTCHTMGVFPVISPFTELNNHALICEHYTAGNGAANARQIEAGRIFINQVSLGLTKDSTSLANPAGDGFNASYYSSQVQNFNITSAFPLALYERSTGQIVGYAKGIFRVSYVHSSPPISTTVANLPRQTKDIDLENHFFVHGISNSSGHFYALGFAIEEING